MTRDNSQKFNIILPKTTLDELDTFVNELDIKRN